MIHAGTFVVQRSPEDVYRLLSDLQRFAPLLPDYESMVVQDATHFQLRVVLEVGQIRGHANLAMELGECIAPSRVAYHGAGVVAGSQLRFGIDFALNSLEATTEVRWSGEVAVEGPLAFMAGGLIEKKSRDDFERMAQRLRAHLSEEQLQQAAPEEQPPPEPKAKADGVA